MVQRTGEILSVTTRLSVSESRNAHLRNDGCLKQSHSGACEHVNGLILQVPVMWVKNLWKSQHCES